MPLRGAMPMLGEPRSVRKVSGRGSGTCFCPVARMPDNAMRGPTMVQWSTVPEQRVSRATTYSSPPPVARLPHNVMVLGWSHGPGFSDWRQGSRWQGAGSNVQQPQAIGTIPRTPPPTPKRCGQQRRHACPSPSYIASHVSPLVAQAAKVAPSRRAGEHPIPLPNSDATCAICTFVRSPARRPWRHLRPTLSGASNGT